MPITPIITDPYIVNQSAPAASLDRLSFLASLDGHKFRLHSRQTMIALSHVIEEHAVAGGPETVLVAAFQRFSLFAFEAPRYRRFAPQIAHAYVLGVPDSPLGDVPNVTGIPLDSDWPLVQEWTVIVRGPRVSVGLFAHDVEGFRLETRSRTFEGLFTTDVAVVDTAIARLHDSLALQPPSFERDHQATFRNTLLVQRALAAQLRRRNAS